MFNCLGKVTRISFSSTHSSFSISNGYTYQFFDPIHSKTTYNVRTVSSSFVNEQLASDFYVPIEQNSIDPHRYISIQSQRYCCHSRIQKFHENLLPGGSTVAEPSHAIENPNREL